MSSPTDPLDLDTRDPSPQPQFDPVRERERILALVRDRKLSADEAEMVCATLTWLAEM